MIGRKMKLQIKIMKEPHEKKKPTDNKQKFQQVFYQWTPKHYELRIGLINQKQDDSPTKRLSNVHLRSHLVLRFETETAHADAWLQSK